MQDIGQMLTHVMQTENCSSTYALLMLSDKGVQDELCVLQPEPSQETCGGLCNQSDIQTNRTRVG